MVIRIYLFPIYLLVGLIGPKKSTPYFINGSFIKLWIAYPLFVSLAPLDLHYSCTFLYIVGHQYPASNIFLCVISIAKCPHNSPSCSFFITICAFVVVKHRHSLLSWPILYNSPFFSVKGSIFLTNIGFCCASNMPSICLVLKNSFTSFNHLSFM